MSSVNMSAHREPKPLFARWDRAVPVSWRLLRTQDNERRHIARELHDSAGQTLAVLAMNLAELVQEARQQSPELARQVEDTQRLVQQLNQAIRTTSYLLHPPLLDEGGLSPALSWYVKGVADRSGLDIRLAIAEEFGRLPRDMELVVFRLIQECLTNIHRHSGSKSAQIQITRQEGSLYLEVQDRGKGISPERVNEIQARGSGLGIRGMRERLRQYAGELHIDSGASGTRILVTIPIPANMTPREDVEPVMPTV
jgi:signal transduction histidine kinase